MLLHASSLHRRRLLTLQASSIILRLSVRKHLDRNETNLTIRGGLCDGATLPNEAIEATEYALKIQYMVTCVILTELHEQVPSGSWAPSGHCK